MRQALSYAVDKKAIVAAVFKDSGTPANSLLPPGMLGYNDKLPEYAYDPQKARELLKQAGLEQGFETDIWSMPVQRPYNPNSKRIAEMIQSDWAKVGVKAKIVTWEWGQYLAGLRKGEQQSALYGWVSDNGDPDNFATLLGCAGVQSGANVARWCDKDYDRLIQQAIQENQPQARAKLYQQAQVIFAKQAPWLPLATGKVFYATRSNLSGYVVDVNGSDFAKAKLN